MLTGCIVYAGAVLNTAISIPSQIVTWNDLQVTLSNLKQKN